MEIKEIVLASAAIPGIIQSRYFEGREFRVRHAYI